MTRRGRTAFIASITVTALVVAAVAPAAEAAPARPPVVQRDGLDRVVLDVSASGRYALTGGLINSTSVKRVDLVTKTSAVMRFEAQNPHLVADGTAVLFESTQKLVSADTNGVVDVYRYTFSTKAFLRIVPANRPTNWEMSLRDISADGKVIAFYGTNGVIASSGIWIYDVVAKTWRRPDAVLPAGVNRQSNEVSLSASGRIAAITSFVTAGAFREVWVYNWSTNTAARVNARTNGTAPTGCEAATPDVSPDGALISFRSTCAGLVAGLSTVKARVFVRNRLTKVTRFVTDKETTDFGPDLAHAGQYHGPQLAANGSMLVLLENRPTKFGTTTLNATQPVLYRISTRENVMLDKPAGTALPNNFSRNVYASSAAKRAVFTSQATNFTTVTSPATKNIDRVFMSTLP